MSEPTLLEVLKPNEPYMFTSRSGRVLQVADALIELLNTDPTGRNLNDLMNDEAAAHLILYTSHNTVYTTDLEICGYLCTCGARLTDDGRMLLIFKLLEDRRDKQTSLELVQYMSRSINESLREMHAALRDLETKKGAERDHARSVLNRALANLFRISRNTSSKADEQMDGLVLQPRLGNLTATLTEVFQSAIHKLSPYHDISLECDAPPVDCIYDPMIVQRAALNLIHHAVSHSPRKRACLSIRISLSDDNIVVRLNSVGSRSHKYSPRLGPGGIPLYGDTLELEIATLLLRALHGSLVSTNNEDGGWLCCAHFPIVPETGTEKFSNLVIDWYGGRDMIEVELAGLLPAEAYRAEL